MVLGTFLPMASPPASSGALGQAPIIAPEHDPIWASILNAPLAEEPETDEERAVFGAIEAGIQARGKEVAGG